MQSELETVEDIAQSLLPRLPARFWLAGFSFGGYVALALLAAAPQRVRGIALLCTTPLADSPATATRRLAALLAVRDGRYLELIDQQTPAAFHPRSLSNAALMAARQDMVRAYGPDRFAAHVRATAARPDRSDLLDGTRPTLVVAASHDQVFAPEAVRAYARNIPGTTLAVIEEAGHLAPMEQPVQMAAALARWMNRDWPAPN